MHLQEHFGTVVLFLEQFVQPDHGDLDDVSGTYVDPVTLALENGPIAAQMANKNADAIVLDGQQRGNPGTKDWYVFAGAILSYRLNKPGTCKKW